MNWEKIKPVAPWLAGIALLFIVYVIARSRGLTGSEGSIVGAFPEIGQPSYGGGGGGGYASLGNMTAADPNALGGTDTADQQYKLIAALAGLSKETDKANREQERADTMLQFDLGLRASDRQFQQQLTLSDRQFNQQLQAYGVTTAQENKKADAAALLQYNADLKKYQADNTQFDKDKAKFSKEQYTRYIWNRDKAEQRIREEFSDAKRPVAPVYPITLSTVPAPAKSDAAATMRQPINVR